MTPTDWSNVVLGGIASGAVTMCVLLRRELIKRATKKEDYEVDLSSDTTEAVKSTVTIGVHRGWRNVSFKLTTHLPGGRVVAQTCGFEPETAAILSHRIMRAVRRLEDVK